MGLAELFLGKENPFSQYVADNRNKIHGAFAGLGQGTDFASGLGTAAGGAYQGGMLDQVTADKKADEAKRLDTINQTAAFLRTKGAEDLAAAVEGGMTSGSDAFNQWYSAQNQKAASPVVINGQLVDPTTGQVVGDYRDQMGEGGSATEYGLTPVYGQFPDGTYGMGVLGKNGTFKPIDTGEMQVFDPRTLASERAAGTETGKFGAGQENTLPSVQIAVANAKNTIESLRNNTQGQDEQFGNILGVPQQMLPMIPGSARANLDVDIQQLSGQAFLQAREFLKGQGQITDFESGKAEAAISRAQVAAQKGDRAAFNRALDDFEAALDSGLAKVAAQAGRSARPAQQPVGQTSTGLTWSVGQ